MLSKWRTALLNISFLCHYICANYFFALSARSFVYETHRFWSSRLKAQTEKKIIIIYNNLQNIKFPAPANPQAFELST